MPPRRSVSTGGPADPRAARSGMTDPSPSGVPSRPRGRWFTVIGVLLVVVGGIAIGLAIAHGDRRPAPGGDVAVTSTTDVVGETAPVGPAGIGSGWTATARGRHVLAGFGQVAATITTGDGRVCHLCLLAAQSRDQWSRGLMGVTDPKLGGHDGMVFTGADSVTGSFWMRDTPQPLAVAYYDADGRFVSAAEMAPCGHAASCRQYPAGGPFRSAVEVPSGRLSSVGATRGSVLRLLTTPCPLV